jgi:pimeloyl-ACP methyl ester carboxylesterase
MQMMNAPVLLLIHGYPFDHTLWELVAPHLDSSLQVLAPDLRGFDGRPPGPAEPSLERMGQDLKQLLDARQIEQAVVAGMSMGGYIALAFAEQNLPRLSGLALISSQAAGDTDEARANRRTMIDKVRRGGPEIAAQAAIPKMFGRRNVQRPDLGRYAEAAAKRAGTEGIAWALEAMARRPDRTEVVRQLKVPLLVLHGAEDQFVPVERARTLAGLATNSRYVEIDGVGHATPLEAPDRVAEALNDLVRRSQPS